MDQIRVEIPGAALNEMVAAKLWYAEHAPGWDVPLMEEIDRAIQLILESPGRWMIFEGETRRIVLRRFPYSLIYRLSDTTVTIVAFSHHKRRPDRWQASR